MRIILIWVSFANENHSHLEKSEKFFTYSLFFVYNIRWGSLPEIWRILGKKNTRPKWSGIIYISALSSSKYKIEIPTITKIRIVPKAYQSIVFLHQLKHKKKVGVRQTRYRRKCIPRNLPPTKKQLGVTIFCLLSLPQKEHPFLIIALSFSSSQKLSQTQFFSRLW